MTENKSLTQLEIGRFYAPLAASWLLMAIEWPVVLGLISRMALPEITTAAVGVAMNISLFIESPVIDLLATSTALSKNQQHYASLKRFVIYLMLAVTLIHGVVAFTPLFDIVMNQVLGIDETIAAAARPTLQIMTLWSAFIGWRRFLQGILIRFGHTKQVGIGTVVRLASMGVAGGGLYASGWISGSVVAGCALMAGVIGEALYVSWASRKVITVNLIQAQTPHDKPLTSLRLLSFHMPMTAATMVILSGGPIISAYLARTPDPVLALAAWPVAGSLLFLFRTFGFALPEVVIALSQRVNASYQLRKFCTAVAFSTTGVVLLLALFGIDKIYFMRVLDVKPEVAQLAHLALLWGCLTPAINAMQSYFRGQLTAHHLTFARLIAIGLSTGLLALLLLLSLMSPWKNIEAASLVYTIALSAELLVLGISWQKGSRKLQQTVHEK